MDNEVDYSLAIAMVRGLRLWHGVRKKVGMELLARFGMLAMGVAVLTGCGDAGAGNEQLVGEFKQSCLTNFVEKGGPADLAEPLCECSANKVRQQKLGMLDMLDKAKMEEIGQECLSGILEQRGEP